jgi:hypothetical protein
MQVFTNDCFAKSIIFSQPRGFQGEPVGGRCNAGKGTPKETPGQQIFTAEKPQPRPELALQQTTFLCPLVMMSCSVVFFACGPDNRSLRYRSIGYMMRK